VRPQGEPETQLDIPRLDEMAVPMAFFSMVRPELAVSGVLLHRRRLHALALGK
jgi:hypothetical protein